MLELLKNRCSFCSKPVDKTHGIDPDLIPSNQTMYEDLLWAFGAWESLEEMNAAMATRVYATSPDGRVGFKLVK